jgi:hypothetical protein
MSKKKEILQKKSVATKVARMKLQKVAAVPKKASLSKAKGICMATPPKVPTYMKAPP